LLPVPLATTDDVFAAAAAPPQQEASRCPSFSGIFACVKVVKVNKMFGLLTNQV